MDIQHIGFLHPGAMGVSLAAAAMETGHKAYWLSQQRSQGTRQRAESHGLIEVLHLEEFCDRCSMIVCVCPPHAAMDVAEKICAHAFSGIYVDVNAVSPERVKQIGQLMRTAGVDFVDGGIIGPPAWNPDTTWLYLSGPEAALAARCFSGGPLGVEVIGSEVGKASALKMCYAAHTKGTTALLCAIMAAADQLGVREELENQWSRQGSDFARNTIDQVRKVTAKAWRFTGEMKEISSTFQTAGLPDGFHRAAYQIYQRIAGFKDAEEPPALDAVIKALLRTGEDRQP